MLSLLALTARAQVSPDSIKFNEHGEFSIVVPVAATSEQIQAYSRSYFIVRDLYASSGLNSALNFYYCRLVNVCG